MESKEKEIRNILVGIVQYEGPYCFSAEEFRASQFSGFNLGSDAARLLPLVYRSHQFAIKGNIDVTRNLCKQGIYEIGQPVYLRESPDVTACLIRPLFTPPVLVILEVEKKEIILNFYTARTIYSSVGIHTAQKKISSCFPDNLIETDVTFQSVSSYSTRKDKKKAVIMKKKAARTEKQKLKKESKHHLKKNKEA